MKVELLNRPEGWCAQCEVCGDLGISVPERSTANHLRLCHYDWHRARDETWQEGHDRWARGYEVRRVGG